MASTTKQQLDELEAAAVDKAKAAADTNFLPSAAALASTALLLQAVDGPSLHTYRENESVYVGRVVPISAGGQLELPINVSAPGSVVEYAIELQANDVEFAITAERDEGITIVKDASRLTVNECPATQKFLVGTVPCLLKFAFSNGYSWLREKHVSYKITVTPPTREALITGRRRRAQACQKAVEQDVQAAAQRLQAATTQERTCQLQLAALKKQLAEIEAGHAQAEQEVTWLQERLDLRKEQQAQLGKRLKSGWEDEVEEVTPS